MSILRVQRNMNRIFVDIMREGLFVCSLNFPIELGMIEEYYNGHPVLRLQAIKRKVEELRPSLSGCTYQIFFC